jgi:hypothetical protein
MMCVSPASETMPYSLSCANQDFAGVASPATGAAQDRPSRSVMKPEPGHQKDLAGAPSDVDCIPLTGDRLSADVTTFCRPFVASALGLDVFFPLTTGLHRVPLPGLCTPPGADYLPEPPTVQ